MVVYGNFNLNIQNKHKQYIESGDHYFCMECGMQSIIPFVNATETEFKCNLCNKELEFLDKERLEELIKLRK